MISPSKRERETSIDHDPGVFTLVDRQESIVEAEIIEEPRDQNAAMPNHAYKRPKVLRFPDAILALPHVLKGIDDFSMTPEEAMIYAASARDLERLEYLMNRFDCDAPIGAYRSAARNGNYEMVDFLTQEDETTYKQNDDRWMVLMVAAKAAAHGGHVDIVALLLPLLMDDTVDDVDHNPRNATWFVLQEAAAGGHLDVVKLATEHARYRGHLNGFPTYDNNNALSLSIHARHFDVVKFLLVVPDFDWNLHSAFEEAMSLDQTATTEIIYKVYSSHLQEGNNLFVHLTHSGKLAALKFLCNNGHDDAALVETAFGDAVSNMKNDVVDFLLSTVLVSGKAFDGEFESAARLGKLNTLTFLHCKKLVSSPSVNNAFEKAGKLAVAKFLLENERIPSDFITAAFHNAAHYETNKTWSSEGFYASIEIMKFLIKEDFIPAEEVNEAFFLSVWNIDVVTFLYNDERLTPKTIGRGFIRAAGNENKDVSRFLCVSTRQDKGLCECS